MLRLSSPGIFLLPLLFRKDSVRSKDSLLVSHRRYFMTDMSIGAGLQMFGGVVTGTSINQERSISNELEMARYWVIDNILFRINRLLQYK